LSRRLKQDGKTIKRKEIKRSGQKKKKKPEEEEEKRKKCCCSEGAEDQQIEAIFHFPKTFRCCYQKTSIVFDDEISAFPFRCSYHTHPSLSLCIYICK
jgi:hypothetical protein